MKYIKTYESIKLKKYIINYDDNVFLRIEEVLNYKGKYITLKLLKKYNIIKNIFTKVKYEYMNETDPSLFPIYDITDNFDILYTSDSIEDCIKNAPIIANNIKYNL